MKRILFATILIALFTTAAASAQVYTVVLKGGSSFDTRYEPVDAEWDDAVSMILTDQGNWIALQKADIIDVTSEIEASGFGTRLDTTTIVLGSYHDYDETSGADAGGQAGQPGQGGAFDPRAAGYIPVEGELLAPAEAESYTIDQFVNTGDAGEGGIPLEYTVYQ